MVNIVKFIFCISEVVVAVVEEEDSMKEIGITVEDSTLVTRATTAEVVETEEHFVETAIGDVDLLRDKIRVSFNNNNNNNNNNNSKEMAVDIQSIIVRTFVETLAQWCGSSLYGS
jgi:hypothetical protein